MSRTFVRYTIPLDSSSRKSHRLGVNSLAIDPTNSGTLFSGGRDGIIAAWDLKMTLALAPARYDDDGSEVQVTSTNGDSTYKCGLQAHTHWVNEIAVSSDYQNIYSCSSDTFVKCWRPNAFQNDKAETLGSHADYVKCLVAPTYTNSWIATAGLDRSILLWNTDGKGETMRIDGSSADGGMKQSIYSLTSGPNLLGSGGIEKVIRIWDVRSGTRITKLIGHTDNVRSLLCSDDGKTFVSASSDTTIKIWDLTAGRCLHTLTRHIDPVWTLQSDHPKLAVFHSADRSGLVLKNDLRPQATGGNDGECVAVCKEDSGINSLSQIGDCLFTATSSSSINRWLDYETAPTDPFADTDAPLSRLDSASSANAESINGKRTASISSHRRPSRSTMAPHVPPHRNGLRLLKHASSSNGLRRSSLIAQSSVVSLSLDNTSISAHSAESLEPIRTTPEATIKGQAGLIAHNMLSDRTRVLTRDTEGRVKLWDITKCQQIADFGIAEMDDIETAQQSVVALGSWCSVNTRVGALTVEMDPRNLLDAETYYDTVVTDQPLDFDTRNQRFSVGKWMLYHIFQGVIEAEKTRDKNENSRQKQRRPGRLDLGDLSSHTGSAEPGQATPRIGGATPTFGSKNPYASAMSTPGASFGLTSPAPTYNPKPNGVNGHHAQGSMSSLGSDHPTSPVVPGDYFSSPHGTRDPDATPMANETPTTPGSMPKTPGGSGLMKNMKWLRSNKSSKSSTSETKKPSPNTPLPPTSPVGGPMPTRSESQPINFKEFVEFRRKAFANQEGKAQIPENTKESSWIQDLEPMPPLKIPQAVDISLAIFKPGEGEAKDIYRGTVGGLAADLDALAPLLPVWLGQILLANEIPAQMQNLESNKLYFSFLPHEKSALKDPFNASASNLMRLGAARSLRVRKALTYISQRLEADVIEKEGRGRSEEEWLEIVVNGTNVDPDWTLLMTRRHLWNKGGDMKLEYRLKSEA